MEMASYLSVGFGVSKQTHIHESIYYIDHPVPLFAVLLPSPCFTCFCLYDCLFVSLSDCLFVCLLLNNDRALFNMELTYCDRASRNAVSFVRSILFVRFRSIDFVRVMGGNVLLPHCPL